MRVRSSVLIAATMVATLCPRSALAVDAAAGNERLGVRAGYAGTSDGLRDFYGDGWDLTLFFTEKVYSRLLLDVRLGAIYLGEALKSDLDDQLTLQRDIVSSMRFLYFSAGPMVGFGLGSSYSGYASAGIGVYSVSMQFDSGLAAFDYSDQHIGYNAGAGLSMRVHTNWCVELNGTIHYVSTDANPNDLFWLFTDGGDAPVILGIALGVVVDLR
jgi:opacity protein-like surface antigen